MKTADFDYELPPDRIAQTPVEPRDSARLMVVHRATGRIEHRVFSELAELLAAGDLLVANDSRVIPARLAAAKADSGGQLEVLLLRPRTPLAWEVLIKGRVKLGSRLTFAGDGDQRATALVAEVRADGTRLLAFDQDIGAFAAAHGAVPLPPYIRSPLGDPERYQTVYARVAGSVAAPTAGLHFTPGLISALAGQGVGLGFVTLHIGLDTFRPVAVDDLGHHPMHAEWCEVSAETATAVEAARAANRRVVAVGTTVVRALETSVRDGAVRPFSGWTDLFITPGYAFQATSALVTNFHLPRSTLLVLVSAFGGMDLVRRAYGEAMDEGYRFYSFGDAMLIL